MSSISESACPRFPNPSNPDQVWQNDQDLDDCITTLSQFVSTYTVTASSSITSGSTNYIQNRSSLQSGATAYPSFLYVGSSASIPSLFSSTGTINSFTSSTGTISVARVSTQTWKGFGILPILQIVQYETVTSSSISNTTFQLTNLSGAITPKISTSKIIVMASGNVSCTGVGVCYASVYRDTTNLSGDGGFETNTAASNNHTTMIYYDSPATTSAVTYSARIRVNGGGVTAAFPGTDGGVYTTTATLLLAEVAQ